MSIEFSNQYFLQGNKEQYVTSLQSDEDSLSFYQKISLLESLIYLNYFNLALHQLEILEKNSLLSKKDHKLLVLMLKALCFTQPSDHNLAFKILKEAELILYNIKNSTLPLSDEFIKFLFTKGQVHYNFLELTDSLKAYQECLQESSKINNKFYQARSLNRIARIHFDMEHYEQAMEQSMKALAVATPNQFIYEIYLGYEMLGLLNQLTNKDQSVKYFEYCLKISNQLQNDVLIAKTLMNIGKTKLLKKELDEANNYWVQSLNFYTKAAYNVDKPILLKNLGDLYSRKGNYDKALEYYKDSYDLSKFKEKYIQGIVLFSIGSVYFRIRDFKNALKYYSDSLEVKKTIGNKIEQAGPLWGIGHIHFIKQNYTKAMENYLDLLTIYQNYGRAEYISEILLIIITLQQELDDKQELRKYLNLLETLVNQTPNIHVNLSFSIAKALSLDSDRLINLSEKLNNFKTILNHLYINQHYTFFSLLNIIALYLIEFNLTVETVVLENIRETIEILNSVAIKTNSYPLELFSNVLLIQLNYLQDKKENNRPLVIKITTLLELINVKEIESETMKVLKKIDRIEKKSKTNKNEFSSVDLLNRIGFSKLVKKIITDKYWL